MFESNPLVNSFDSIATILYIGVGVFGYLVAMTLTGLVVLPMQIANRPSMKLVRRSAALAAFPGGLFGLMVLGYAIYAVWKIAHQMDAVYDSFPQGADTEGLSFERPSVWSSLPAIQTVVQLVVLVLATLMIIPAIRRPLVPYLLLILLSLGTYGYAVVQLISALSQLSGNPFMSGFQLPTGIWVFLFAGFFGYFIFFIIALVIGRMRMRLKEAAAAQQQQPPYPPQYQQQQYQQPPYPPQQQQQQNPPPQPPDPHSPFQPPQPPVPPQQ